MAQNIILKRSAVSGKVPTTSSLNVGELAINTFDGRVFLHRSSSIAESVEHIVTTNSITTGSITLTQTGSFAELIVSQDGNFNRDIYVANDIVGNGDLDIGGTITASLQQGYILVGNGGNHTKAIPTSSLVTAPTDLSSLNSKTGSYATTGSNIFIGNQIITGSVILSGSLGVVTFDPNMGYYDIYYPGINSDAYLKIETDYEVIAVRADDYGTYIEPSNSANRIVFKGNVTSFEKNVVVTGSFTASLQEGYAWVGNGNGKTKAVATASFSTLLPPGVLSSSNTTFAQFTGSYYTDSSSFDYRISNIGALSTPPGTISGSQQITAFGFVSGSYETTGRNIVSSSASTTTIAITITNGIISAVARGGIVSSSTQLSESFEARGSGILSSSITFDEYTSSVDNSITYINQTTASLNVFSSSTNNRLDSLEITASFTSRSAYEFTSLTGSFFSLLSDLANKTGSYATTGSNIFVGDQTISGSTWITGDLIVIGSSSISNISASAVSIGTNTVILNTFTPAVRFGGISVYDSGSNAGTGSLWWDSVNNHWIYEHPADSEADYNSAILISGPKNTDGLGAEIGLTAGKLTVAVGDDHISSSQITDDGQTVSIAGNLTITGSFTSSLQEGYFYIGGAGNIATTVSTGSFVPLQQKAGAVSGSAFTGVLRKSTVTFITPFANTNYSVTVTSEAPRVFTIENKTTGSFVINTNTRAPMSGLTYWIAMAYGESVT